MHTFLSPLKTFKQHIYFEKKKVDPKICLMIHNQNLLFIEMHKKHPNYVVHKIIRRSIADSLDENNQLRDDNSFSDTLKQLCIEHDIHAKKVIFISSDNHILMRIFTIPKSNAKGISEYIYKQLSSYTLFSGHELHKNWKILDTVTVNQEPHYRVVVLACKRDTFRRWNTIMQHAQLSLFGITTHSAGLIHQFSTLENSEDKIIVCAEPNQTSYMAWNDRGLQHIHYGSTPLRKLINTNNASQNIDSIIHLLNSNNTRSQVYFYAPFLEENHKEALESLMKETKATFLPIDSFLDHCLVNPDYEPLVKITLPAIGAGKMTADDLLILGLTQGRPYFKLLLTYFLASLSLASIVMLSIFFLFYYQSKGLNQEIQVVKNELIATNKEFQVVQKIDSNINIMKKLIIARRKLNNDIHQFDAEIFYANLSTLVTEDTRIQSFKMDDKGEIVIHGEAIRSDAVFKLLQNLKNSPFFLKVKLNKVENNSRQNTVEFTITIQRGDGQ
ncbi:MAG: PilN domain-containing protein [bacterium]